MLSLRIWIVLVLTLSCTVVNAQERDGDFGWLRGEVHDADTGEPVVYARIQALFGRSLWEGMTDYDGAYVIRVPWGPFVMTAEAEGYILFKEVGKVDRRTMTFVDIQLDPLKKEPSTSPSPPRP